MVEVQFSVVGNIKSKDDIKKLYVQFKTKGQCCNFISSLDKVSIRTTESNMESYYNVEDKEGEAAIVPKHIADLEKEMFTIDNVTDSNNNYTRFVIIKYGKCKKDNMFSLISGSNEDKMVRISLFIIPKIDGPGVLFNILKSFYKNNINLISIMSRPTKKR